MFKVKIKSNLLKTITMRVLIPFFVLILLFIVVLLVLPMRTRIMLTGGFLWSFIQCPLENNETICLTRPLFATTIYEYGPPKRTFVFTFSKEKDLRRAKGYLLKSLCQKEWDLRAENINPLLYVADENTTYSFLISCDKMKLMEMKLEKTHNGERTQITGEIHIVPNLLYPEDPPHIVIDLTESE